MYPDTFGARVEISVVYHIHLPLSGAPEKVREEINYEIYRLMYRYGKGFGHPLSVNIEGSDENQVAI